MKNVITINSIETPLGSMLAGYTKDGICFLEFIDTQETDKDLDKLSKLLNAKIVEGYGPNLKVLTTQLNQYFREERRDFTLPMVVVGTPFQTKVWNALQKIPYGETISYQEQAKLIGRPKAVRAVARANGSNRIAILIPCHRIIGKNGRLVGYGGGLWRKKRLLAMEKAMALKRQAINSLSVGVKPS